MGKWIGGIVATIIAGVITFWITEEMKSKPKVPPNQPPIINPSPPATSHAKCEPSWSWSASRGTCIQSVSIPETRYSINLDRRISSVAGRVDFYLNQKRLPGQDSQGRAMYEPALGVVQVVSSIMLGKVMVGDMRQVIFSTNQGKVCELQGLPRATGWMKKMQVRYLLLLEECGSTEKMCSASLEPHGKRVQIKTKALRAVIAKNC